MIQWSLIKIGDKVTYKGLTWESKIAANEPKDFWVKVSIQMLGKTYTDSVEIEIK